MGVTTNKTDNWFASGVTPQTDSRGTFLGASTSFIYRAEQPISGDFEAKVYVFDITSGVRVGVTADAKNTRGVIYNPRYIKIRRKNGVVTISASTDDTIYTEITYDVDEITTEDCKFLIYSYTSGGIYRSIKYNNLVIYSI